MGTKSITITNEAYEMLATFKEGSESFSDVIKKLSSKYSLLKLVGTLSNDEAIKLEKNISEINKRIRTRISKIRQTDRSS